MWAASSHRLSGVSPEQVRVIFVPVMHSSMCMVPWCGMPYVQGRGSSRAVSACLCRSMRQCVCDTWDKTRMHFKRRERCNSVLGLFPLREVRPEIGCASKMLTDLPEKASAPEVGSAGEFEKCSLSQVTEPYARDTSPTRLRQKNDRAGMACMTWVDMCYTMWHGRKDV